LKPENPGLASDQPTPEATLSAERKIGQPTPTPQS
jgi:hypothetical protein